MTESFSWSTPSAKTLAALPRERCVGNCASFWCLVFSVALANSVYTERLSSAHRRKPVAASRLILKIDGVQSISRV